MQFATLGLSLYPPLKAVISPLISSIEYVPEPQTTVAGNEGSDGNAIVGVVTNESNEQINAITSARFLERKKVIVLMLITLQVSG